MIAVRLPSEWFKQDAVKPEKLFPKLDQIIAQCSIVVESAESYKSAV